MVEGWGSGAVTLGVPDVIADNDEEGLNDGVWAFPDEDEEDEPWEEEDYSCYSGTWSYEWHGA